MSQIQLFEDERDIKQREYEQIVDPILSDMSDLPHELSFDIENATDGSIICVSFAWDDGSKVIWTRGWNKSDFQKLVRVLQEKVLTGYNAIYDVEQLFLASGLIVPVKFDAFYAAFWLFVGEGSYTLKSVAMRKLGMAAWGSAKEMIAKYGGMQFVPEDELEEYAKTDAIATWRLGKMLEGGIKDAQLSLIMKLECDVISPTVRMKEWGVKIDRDLLGDSRDELTILMDQEQQTIFDMAGRTVFLTAPADVSKMLFDDLGIDATGLKVTKTGYVSTNASQIEQIKDKHPVVEHLLTWRKLHKLISVFISELDWASQKYEDGRARPNWKPMGSWTGRFSCSGPNLQNVPIRSESGRVLRRMIIAEDGHKLVVIDYSQMQLMILAVFANSSRMKRIFEENGDIHAETARIIYHVDDVTDSQRKDAKSVNFGLIFGGGPGLFRQFGFTWQEANKLYNRFFKEYQLEGFKQLVQKSIKRGYSLTYLGRRIQLPKSYPGMSRRKRALQNRLAMNYPIQGTEGDLVKKAMILMEDVVLEHDSKMILQIHDELVFEVPDNKVQDFCRNARIAMEGIRYPIQLKVDVAVGMNWLDTVEA